MMRMDDKPKNRWRCFIPSFRGRLGMKSYLYQRVVVYETIFAIVVSGIVLIRIMHFWAEKSSIMVTLHVIGLIILYPIILLVSLQVRRLHDVGLAAHWIFNPFFMMLRKRMGLSEPGEPGVNKWGQNPDELHDNISSTPLSPMSREKLKEVYRAALRSKDPNARLELGRCYFYGHGMVQNRVLAFYWISKALEEKCPAALEFINKLSSECKND